MASDRIRATITTQSGSSAADFLAAVRDYAVEKDGNPWLLRSRRPLRLTHASPRAEGVTYTFAKVDAERVSLLVAGKRARLGLAYVVTLLANARLQEHPLHVELEINTA